MNEAHNTPMIVIVIALLGMLRVPVMSEDGRGEGKPSRDDCETARRSWFKEQ
jgi:hypothetical protein